MGLNAFDRINLHGKLVHVFFLRYFDLFGVCKCNHFGNPCEKCEISKFACNEIAIQAIFLIIENVRVSFFSLYFFFAFHHLNEVNIIPLQSKWMGQTLRMVRFHACETETKSRTPKMRCGYQETWDKQEMKSKQQQIFGLNKIFGAKRNSKSEIFRPACVVFFCFVLFHSKGMWLEIRNGIESLL